MPAAQAALPPSLDPLRPRLPHCLVIYERRLRERHPCARNAIGRTDTTSRQPCRRSFAVPPADWPGSPPSITSTARRTAHERPGMFFDPTVPCSTCRAHRDPASVLARSRTSPRRRSRSVRDAVDLRLSAPARARAPPRPHGVACTRPTAIPAAAPPATRSPLPRGAPPPRHVALPR